MLDIASGSSEQQPPVQSQVPGITDTHKKIATILGPIGTLAIVEGKVVFTASDSARKIVINTGDQHISIGDLIDEWNQNIRDRLLFSGFDEQGHTITPDMSDGAKNALATSVQVRSDGQLNILYDPPESSIS